MTMIIARNPEIIWKFLLDFSTGIREFLIHNPHTSVEKRNRLVITISVGFITKLLSMFFSQS